MDQKTQIYKKIGKLIRSERQKRKLTQDNLADRVGLTRTSITNIENGSQKIQLHNLYSIAKVFKMPLHELLPEVEFKTDDLSEVLPMGLSPIERKWALNELKKREEKQYENKKKNGD